MNCLLCQEMYDIDMLNHMRMMHPDVAEDLTAAMSRDGKLEFLKPVTQRMNDEDWVCERCDTQFALGQVFGEEFEGIVGDMPIISLVCGTCFGTVAE